MKKKIGLIFLVIALCCICFGLGYFLNKRNEINIESTNSLDEKQNSYSEKEDTEGIPKPDRIVFKYESKYYEIMPDYEKYDELVNLCRDNINKSEETDITEENIDSLKSTAKFIEFDYNTISKNYIFVLTSDIGAIKMKDSDGIVISNRLSNIDKIGETYLEAIKDKNGYEMTSEKIVAMNQYLTLPSTNDFKNVKDEKVYVKNLDSYDEFQKIVDQYNLKFDSLNTIKNKFENKKAVLVLTQYDIKDYKINIGNVKINFSGTDFVVTPVGARGYNVSLILISKIVNTNCIYYNYDEIKIQDNLTGTVEKISGVVQSKDADEIMIAYTSDENAKVIGKVMLSSKRLINKTVYEVEVGDFVSGTATVTGSENGVKLYDADSLSVQDKEEYNKLLKNYLNGKSKIDTVIIDYYQAESNYDGYVICPLYYGENSNEPDAYFRANYDFYENNTESYLGMNGDHLTSNYGIQPNEIVDITFTEPISDVNNIIVKMFEYIAD